jgi:hypothetical protein
VNIFRSAASDGFAKSNKWIAPAAGKHLGASPSPRESQTRESKADFSGIYPMVPRWTISIRLTGLYERLPGKDLPARSGDLVRAVGLVRRWPTRDIVGLATSSGSDSTRSLDICGSSPSRTAARMLVPSSSFSGPSGGSQPRFPLVVYGGSVRLTPKSQYPWSSACREGARK